MYLLLNLVLERRSMQCLLVYQVLGSRSTRYASTPVLSLATCYCQRAFRILLYGYAMQMIPVPPVPPVHGTMPDRYA